MVYQSEAGNISVMLSGDTMLTRRLSVHDEPAYRRLVALYRSSDVGFVNLEGNTRHWDEGRPNVTRGTYMTTPPGILEDLKWFGIDLVSCANNHSFDYGEDGVLATIRHLDRVGIAHAGTGANLAEALAPGYLDTANGRVALVSATAAYRPWNAAAQQRPDMAGRPGINPLSWSQTFRVDEAAFAQLQRMSERLGFQLNKVRARGHFYSADEVHDDDADEIEFQGERYLRGKSFAVTTAVDDATAAANLTSIAEARRQADWVIFSLHYHEFGGKSVMRARTRTELEDPADFVRDMAHRAIDAGADIFVGHGPHIPLGIEIYKGRPILYSVGSFIFQNETVKYFPDPAYARFGLGPEATPADFLDARTDGGKKGHPAHRGFWENVAVGCEFAKGRLAEVRVHPVDMGFGRPRPQRGRPVLASGAVAKRILGRMARLSKTYGTTMRVERNTGVIKPSRRTG
ncbi:MAG: CapA family protein [Alphaproteobacteria bacterium]|nr:CapA family protein [Alphaproteobacteria bacterium]